MDTAYSVHDQPPFHYYPVDSASQYRHPNHYAGHPSEMQHYYGPFPAFSPQHQPCLPEPQPIFASQPILNMQPVPNTSAFAGGVSNMTPLASPQSSQMKPAIVVQDSHSHPHMSLDTHFIPTDFYGFSSPPPLSTPGSTISSPPSTSDVLHTPVSEGFFNFEKVEGVKEGCESEVHSEILANADWSRSNTPPMTPGKLLKFDWLAFY